MFSDHDKEQIRRWLGYPADTVNLNAISTRCAAAYAAAPAILQTVRSHLRELARIEQQRKASRPFADRTLTSNASGTSQRSPSFAKDFRIEEMRSYIDEISLTLRLPVQRYPGDLASGWSTSGRLRRG